MNLWSKNGGAPQYLPESDIGLNADDEPWNYSPLEGNEEALAACGWSPVPEQPEYDPILQRAVWVGGAWVLEKLVGEELESNYTAHLQVWDGLVNTAMQRMFERGYLPAHPAFNVDDVEERLQLRDADDKANWQIALAESEDAIKAGYGDVPEIVGLRAASNRTVMVSPNEAKAILIALRKWGVQMLYRSWWFKDGRKTQLTLRPIPEPYNLNDPEQWPK